MSLSIFALLDIKQILAIDETLAHGLGHEQRHAKNLIQTIKDLSDAFKKRDDECTSVVNSELSELACKDRAEELRSEFLEAFKKKADLDAAHKFPEPKAGKPYDPLPGTGDPKETLSKDWPDWLKKEYDKLNKKGKK